MKGMNRVSLAAGMVMLGLIAADILMLADMKAAIQAGAAMREWMGAAVAVFLVAIGLSHLLGLANLFAHSRHFRNADLLRSLAFVIGFLSLFLLATDVVMLNDIGHEYNYGHNIAGEWNVVFAGHAIHGLFAVLLLIQCLAAQRALAQGAAAAPAVKDESLFLAVNQIGALSAALGFVCALGLSLSGLAPAYLGGLLSVLCLVLVAPYGLAAGYWLYTRRQEKPVEWYDEKQFADISRGALATLIFTAPIVLALYFLLSFGILTINVQIFLSIYIFMVLFLFSGSTLYLSKRA